MQSLFAVLPGGSVVEGRSAGLPTPATAATSRAASDGVVVFTAAGAAVQRVQPGGQHISATLPAPATDIAIDCPSARGEPGEVLVCIPGAVLQLRALSLEPLATFPLPGVAGTPRLLVAAECVLVLADTLTVLPAPATHSIPT